MTAPGTFDGRGIVYFGNDWYAENRTSSHHIAQRLARVAPVLYVDSPGLRVPHASGRDLRRALRKLLATLRPPTPVGDRLWHCTVPQLPFRRVPGVEAFNRLFGQWAVRRAMRKAGIGRSISWFVAPHPGFLARRLGEDLCVYYCVDDFAAHPGVDAARVAAQEEHLARTADLVFVAPPALVEARRALNPNTIFSPHGVDIDLFAQAAQPGEVAAAARGLVHPVVGYFGSLHEWIDFDLIGWLARRRPQWTFLLVGYAASDVSALAALPNIVMPGPQPYAELPKWARAFDAAIIPYKLNRQVAHANPLKLREYLATGKPVVSVRNPEIEKFAEWVRVVDGRDAFLAALDDVLAHDPPGAAAARMAAVAGQSWDRRAAEVIATVESRLAGHAGAAAMREPAQ